MTQTIDWQSYFHCSQQYLHQINSSSEFASLVFSPFNTHWNRIYIFSIEYNLLPILPLEYSIVRIFHRDTNDRSTVTTSLLAAISTSDKFTQWILYLSFQSFRYALKSISILHKIQFASYPSSGISHCPNNSSWHERSIDSHTFIARSNFYIR